MWLVVCLPLLSLLALVIAEARRGSRRQRRQFQRVRDALLPEEVEAHHDRLRKIRSDEIKAMKHERHDP